MKVKILLCLVSVTLMLLGVFMIGLVSAQPTTIGVEPQSIVDLGLVPGSTFTVEIWIRQVEDLAGVEFHLGYDTAVLTATLIEYGDIFGTTYFPLISEINDTEGWLTYGMMEMFGEPGFYGDGRAAIITFSVDSEGESVLDLYDTKLGDSDVVPIVHEALDGYFRNIPAQYSLTISATAGGTTDPVPGVYTYVEDMVVTVTAVPDSGYFLHHWELDGVNVGDTNPIEVTMDMNHTLHANFSAAPPTEYSLTITSGSGGTTDPSPGTYTYVEGTVVTVTATPDSGYLFDHWTLDGTNVGDTNPIEVTMDMNHTLHAVFSELPQLTVEVSADPTTVYSGGTSTIKVSVTSGGTAITGATINLTSDKGGTFSTVTNHANGTYTATFTALDITTETTCTITADVSKSGYTSGLGQTQVTVQPLVLYIYVKDADGNPIADATVVSTAQPSGQAPINGTTDANGLVVFTGILKGSYTIKASKTGYEDKTVTATVIAGQATTDTFILSKLAEAPGFPLTWIAIAVILIAVVSVGVVFAIKKTRTPKP